MRILESKYYICFKIIKNELFKIVLENNKNIDELDKNTNKHFEIIRPFSKFNVRRNFEKLDDTEIGFIIEDFEK